MRQTSEAAQVLIAIVPIVGIVMSGVVAFFYLLWGHREKKLMIERGSYQPAPLRLDIFSLLAGLLLSAVGVVLTVVFALVSPKGYTLLGGLLPLALGLGLLIFYLVRGRHHQA